MARKDVPNRYALNNGVPKKDLNGTNPYNYAKLSAQITSQAEQKANEDPAWAEEKGIKPEDFGKTQEEIDAMNAETPHYHTVKLPEDYTEQSNEAAQTIAATIHTHSINTSSAHTHSIGGHQHTHALPKQPNKIVKMASTVVKVRSGPGEAFSLRETIRKSTITYPCMEVYSDEAKGEKWVRIKYSGWVRESDVIYQ